MASSTKQHQYFDSCILYGFTSFVEQSQRVKCNKVLSEGSMKPIFLKHHLRGLHPALANKDDALFKRKEVGLKRARLDNSGHSSLQKQAGLRAACMVSLMIKKTPHTNADDLKDNVVVRISLVALSVTTRRRSSTTCICQTALPIGKYQRWRKTPTSGC